MKISNILNEKELCFISHKTENFLCFGKCLCHGYKIDMRYSSFEKKIYILWRNVFDDNIIRAKIIEYSTQEWLSILDILPFEKYLALSDVGRKLLEREEK